MSVRQSAAVAVAALFLAACGEASPSAQAPSGPVTTLPEAGVTLPSIDSPQSAPATTPTTAAPSDPTSKVSVLPNLVVDDISTGAKVNLASLAPSPEPLLVWFWAPH